METNITVNIAAIGGLRVPAGTSLLALAAQYPEACRYDILLAKLNNELRELNFTLTEGWDGCFIEFLDITDPGGPGSTISTVPGPGTAAQRINLLVDINRHAVRITQVSGGFTDRMMLGLVLVPLAAVIAFSPLRPWLRSALSSAVAAGRARRLVRLARRLRARLVPVRRALAPLLARAHGWALPALQVVAVAVAALPVASFLSGLVPWWRATDPSSGFWWTVTGFVAGITVVAFVGPWRRSRTGPVAVVAAVTTLVLTADAALGGRLVVDSPLGAHRILGARFYGASNQSFALLSVGALVLAALVARSSLARGWRTAAWMSVAVIGLVVIAADGAPGMGADFGGPLAMLLAFLVVVSAVAGRRVRLATVLAVVGVAVVVVGGFAVLDWLRPPQDRTHLGRFVATVISGGMWPMIESKISTNLRLLSNMRYLLPTLVGTATTVWLVGLGRRTGARWRRGALSRLTAAEPLVRPTTAAVAVVLGVGSLTNDSGVVIVATGLALAVPLLVALACGPGPAVTGDEQPATEPRTARSAAGR